MEDSTQTASAAEREYVTADHLGSTRLVTDVNGGVGRRLDYFPFGEQIPASATFSNRHEIQGYNQTLNWRHMFTGKERDAETGLDYFGARYFRGNNRVSLNRLLRCDCPLRPRLHRRLYPHSPEFRHSPP